jgi:putative endonuclease
VKYVYILQSLADEERFYVGVTGAAETRLAKHNSGSVFHTAKYRPWRIFLR